MIPLRAWLERTNVIHSAMSLGGAHHSRTLASALCEARASLRWSRGPTFHLAGNNDFCQGMR